MSELPQPERVLGGGAIRVFGDVADRLPSRATWNDPARWRSKYAGIEIPGDVIAENFLGEQYVVVDSLVARWDPETGDSESTGMPPHEWIAAMAEDVSDEVPVWLLQAWERAHGPLPVTQHLAPKLFYVLGGEFAVDNLYAATAESDMEWRAQLAQRIRLVPDGTEAKLRLRWKD